MSQAQRIHQDAELLSRISRLVWAASDAIMAVYASDAFGESAKADDSPVTAADLAAHRVLVDGLATLTREIPVVSEEDASSVETGRHKKCYWLIDPLDGTKEFINRNDEFTCNLALIEDHRPTFGLVSIPALGLLYSGGPGLGSRRITRDDQLTTLHPVSVEGLTRVVASKSHLNQETQAFINAIPGEIELIQAGSSLKFLRIAEGLADCYPRLGPTCEWDTAAAHAVVLGAGGSVTDLDGEELRYGKDDILNPHFVVRGPA